MSQEQAIESILAGDQLQPIYDVLARAPNLSAKLWQAKNLRLLFEKFDSDSIIKLIDHCVLGTLISLNDEGMNLLLTAIKTPHGEELTTEIKRKILGYWWPKFDHKSFVIFVDKLMHGPFRQESIYRINFLKYIVSYFDDYYIFGRDDLLKILIQNFSSDDQSFINELETLLISALKSFAQDESKQSFVRSKTKKSKNVLLNDLFFELIETLDHHTYQEVGNITDFGNKFLLIIIEAIDSIKPPRAYGNSTVHELCLKSCSLQLLDAVVTQLNALAMEECTATKKGNLQHGQPLHYAAKYSTFAVFEYIANRTADLNTGVNNSETALMLAVGGVHAKEKVQYLLTCGREIGLANQDSYTQKNCLHRAVMAGNSNVVRLLMATENARQTLIKSDRVYEYKRWKPNRYPLEYALALLYRCNSDNKPEYRDIILSLIGNNPDSDFTMTLYRMGVIVSQQVFGSASIQAIEDELLFFSDKFPTVSVLEPALKLGSVVLLRKAAKPFPSGILHTLLKINNEEGDRRTKKAVNDCFRYLASTQPELIHDSENGATLLTLTCGYHHYDVAAYLFYHTNYELKVSDCDLISDFDITSGSLHLLTAILNTLSQKFSSHTATRKKLPVRTFTVHYDAENADIKRRLSVDDSIHDEMRDYVKGFNTQYKFERSERNLAVVCLTFFGRTDTHDETYDTGKKKYTRGIFHVRLNINSDGHVNSQGEDRSRFRHMVIAGYTTDKILESKKRKDECSRDNDGGFFLDHWHSERSLLSKLTTSEHVQSIIKSLIEQHCRKIYAILVNIYTENYPCDYCVEAADITQAKTDKNATFVDVLNQEIDTHNNAADENSKLIFKRKASSHVLTLFSASTPWPTRTTKRLERDEHQDNDVIDLKSPPSQRILFRDSVSIPPTKSSATSQAKYTVASSGCDKVVERAQKRAKTIEDEPNSAPSNK